MTTEGLFVSTDGSGNIPIIKQYTDWDRDWNLIIPGNFGGDGHTDLLFYKRSGTGLFVSTDGSGNIPIIKQYTDWDRDWNLIIPGNFGGDGHTDLLFYKRSAGIGLFVTTDGSGNISIIKQYTDWDRDWDVIIPGNFGGDGYTDLLFYKRSGVGLFVSTDGSGNIQNIRQYTDWDRYWRLITPGDFGGNEFTDLLFYGPPRPPRRPTGLRVTGIAAGKIDVAWTDNSNDEDGFRVRFRGRRQGQGDHTGTISVGPNSVAASLTDLYNNYEYSINVVAFNASGQSPRSNIVVATTPNVPQAKTVALRRQIVVSGNIPYLGKYPEFGGPPPGRILRIRVPERSLPYEIILRFVRSGHSTVECGNPNAVVSVAEGQTISPVQMTAIYGVPEPRYPMDFLACLGTTSPTGIIDSVDIEITIMED
jgi:hypothetical protein